MSEGELDILVRSFRFRCTGLFASEVDAVASIDLLDFSFEHNKDRSTPEDAAVVDELRVIGGEVPVASVATGEFAQSRLSSVV